MFKNYFKTAFRSLWKSKAFSAINIVGLAIGMAAFIFIMLFVTYEKSFDNLHTKNIYRLNEVQKFEGMLSYQKVGLSMFPMGPTLKDEFPEIKNFTRISWQEKVQMTYGDTRVYMPSMYFVDSTFLQLFDFPLLRGDRKTALQQPNSVVLTESGAEKLFGKGNPIGKTVMHYGNDTLQFVVTGILKDVPTNSQFQFEGLFSFNTIYKPEWMNAWGGNWLDTYFELEPGTHSAALEKKFPGYLKKYLARNDDWKMYELFLLPLRSIHAGSSDIGLDYINFQKFDKKYTQLFFVIALIVLLIACINFVNLSTAKSAERAKEVGIRKSIGAYRWQLSLQFISESVVLSLIASVLAIVLVKLFLPYVNRLSDRALVFPLFGTSWSLWLVLGGSVIVGVLSGLFPAAYLSSFKAAKVLKGSVHSGRNKGQVRNILVVGQFSSAIFLMIATIFAIRQLNFMRQQDPGFSRDQVVSIPMDGITYRKYDLLKQELSGSSLVSGVTASRDLLGSHLDQTGVEFRAQKGPLRQLASTFLVVDHDYLTLYKIPLVLGNNFSSDPQANGKEYIVNEALAKELLKEDQKAPLSSLIGAHFGFDSLGKIVGIAKDFNFNSLHYKIETLFLINEKQRGLNNISVKINGSEVKAALSFIGSVWKKNFPDHPFEYQFLDEHFAELYGADNQVSKIVEILAGLAIFISCLGLFGLASYSAEKRTKEIGIRKVLGASVQNIVGMLSRDFLRYVLIAALIAWPLAWWSVTRWLQDYAYRIPVSWWVFLLAGLGAVVIALATISFQAIRAAVANPVEALRSE